MPKPKLVKAQCFFAPVKKGKEAAKKRNGDIATDDEARATPPPNYNSILLSHFYFLSLS
jgi:hypothetical protein